MDTNTVALLKPAVASSPHGAGERSLSPADGGPVPLNLDEAEKVSGGSGQGWDGKIGGVIWEK